MSVTFDELGSAPVGASAIMHVGEFLFIRVVKADDSAYEGTVSFWKDGTTVTMYESTSGDPRELVLDLRFRVCNFAYDTLDGLDWGLKSC